MKTNFFVLFLILLAGPLVAQTRLQGILTDKDNTEPVAGASVYLLELNKGTASDDSGAFTINGLGRGTYHLLVSHLGYEDDVSVIHIFPGDSEYSLAITLGPQPLRMNEVVVSGAYTNPGRQHTYAIESLHTEKIQAAGAVNIMELLEQEPGLDAITTGPMVSRPVIRGLSGNRVLTVVDGARFETQQWDDEHGIGVNELGTGRIEVVKGPASLLYGPEAMGGVIRFVPEQPAEVGTRKGSATAALYSNNLGFYGKVDLKGAKEQFNWGTHALGRLLSDYFYNRYSFRVPNTRLLEYGGKGYAGINGTWGSSRLSYTFNRAYYGILDGKDIVRNEEGQLVNTDSLEKEKFPFEIEAPFHTVTDHRLNLKTTLLTGTSKLELLLGYQNNHRAENEELSGNKKGYAYLDMALQTTTYDLKWFLPDWEGIQTIIGVQGLLQKNNNLPGAATLLIPDGRVRDLGFLALTEYSWGSFTASLGARYDRRHLGTDAVMDSVNTMPAIKRDYDNISGSAGMSYRPGENWLFRASYASGYRAPNLNELLANGVKLETRQYERGNVDFEKETNGEADVSLQFTAKDISLELAAFYNHIYDYIYLAPTGNSIPGNIDPSESYPEYRFLQGDARIRGGEARVDVHPSSLPWVHFETSASTLKGTLQEDGTFLPVMPATKLRNTIFFTLPHLLHFEDFFFNLGTVTAYDQGQVATDEAQTPGYTLLNAAIGAHFHHADVTLFANNLLDRTYLDHLSRFRAFDIVEPGLNVSLSIKIPFDNFL